MIKPWLSMLCCVPIRVRNHVLTLPSPSSLPPVASTTAQPGSCTLALRREVSKNETFWHDSDPWRIFSTPSRVLWAFPRAL